MQQREELEVYFAERVTTAVGNQGVVLSDEGRGYLTDLLVRSAKAETHFQGEQTTLAELHLEAAHSDRGRALSLYRRLGDRALFVAGWFSESLERRAVGLSYYTDMGEAAYDRVAGLASVSPLKDWTELFGELARRFGECVGVVAEVAEGDDEPQDSDVLRLYELWQKTRSPYAARRLARLGILAAEGGAA